LHDYLDAPSAARIRVAARAVAEVTQLPDAFIRLPVGALSALGAHFHFATFGFLAWQGPAKG
jgi:hypothetical protein